MVRERPQQIVLVFNPNLMPAAGTWLSHLLYQYCLKYAFGGQLFKDCEFLHLWWWLYIRRPLLARTVRCHWSQWLHLVCKKANSGELLIYHCILKSTFWQVCSIYDGYNDVSKDFSFEQPCNIMIAVFMWLLVVFWRYDISVIYWIVTGVISVRYGGAFC